MANKLKIKRGLAATLPNGDAGEPLFTTDTYELYVGKGDGSNQRFQKFIASGATTQILRGDGSLYSFPLSISSPSAGQVLKYNGTSWVNDSDTDTGITTLNTLTATTQTFATGTSGTDFNISSATSTHTFNIPTASATNRGALSSTDWTTFNNKQNALTNPVTGTGTSGQVAFWNGTTTQTGDNGLFWDNTNKRLGIGTTTPTVSLTVKNTSSTTPVLITGYSETALSNIWYDSGAQIEILNNIVNSGFAGAGTGIKFYMSTNGNPQAAIYGIRESTTISALAFYTQNANFSVLERMRITSGGNLLVGTTTDGGQKLQVNGSGLFTDSLYIFKSSNSGSGSVFPTIQVKNTLATQGDGSSTFNFSGIYVGSGNDAVLMTISTTYASGTWAPAGILNVITNHDLQIKTNNTTRLTIASTGAATFSSSVTATNTLNVLSSGTPTAFIKTTADSSADATLYIGGARTANSTADIGGIQLWNYGNQSTSGQYAMAVISGRDPSANNTLKNGALIFQTSNGGVLAERARIDNLGNLGLGVTPSAWRTSWKVLQISSRTSIIAATNGQPIISDNAYQNTSNQWIYLQSSIRATNYEQDNGTHYWYNAPSGTAGNAISFTQAMTLASTGNLLVGTTTDGGFRLDVNGTARVSGQVTGNSFVPTSSTVPTNGIYLPAANKLAWSTNTTFRMILDDSGRLGINTNSPTNGFLHVNASANNYSGYFTSSTTSGQSLGLYIQAGTTSADYSFIVASASGSTNYMTIIGDGKVAIGNSAAPLAQLHVFGDIRTDAPTGGTARNWKLGQYNTTAPSATGYVEVEVNGTLYKLLAST